MKRMITATPVWPRWRFAAAALLGTLLIGSSHAAILELSFSGTYNTMGTTVFGLSGPAVPYNYEITYDTALNTSAWFFPAGSLLGQDITTHEWHGYSASGIVGCSLTFGTQTWSAADIVPREVVAGVSADLWFDTDLDLASPTRVWAFFSDPSDNELQIGAGVSESPSIFLEPVSRVLQQSLFLPTADSSDLSVQVVPEPGVWALLVVGGLVWLCLNPDRSRGLIVQR